MLWDFPPLPFPTPPRPAKNTEKKDCDECAQLKALIAKQNRQISELLTRIEALEKSKTGENESTKRKAARKDVQPDPPAAIEMETEAATTEQPKEANEPDWAKPFQCLTEMMERLTNQISTIASKGEQLSAKVETITNKMDNSVKQLRVKVNAVTPRRGGPTRERLYKRNTNTTNSQTPNDGEEE